MNNEIPLDLVPMGKILKPKGLKGEFKVVVFNEFDSALEPGMHVWMTLNGDKNVEKIIESVKISTSKSLMKFENCNCIEDIQELVGLNFSLSRSLFLPLSKNEIYLVDLVGYKVCDKDQSEVGVVKDIMLLPNQNIIVVDSFKGEILIPFVDAHIKFFDKKEKLITVDSIEGLFS